MPGKAQAPRLPRLQEGPLFLRETYEGVPQPQPRPGLQETSWTVKGAWGPEPRRPGSNPSSAPTDAELLSASPSHLQGFGSGSGQGCSRSRLARNGEGGRHPGSLTENVCAACYFYFTLPPRAGAPWCKRSHRTPPGTVAAPSGVARSELTVEKTTPSLPAVCSCSQNYFYSNIHLFTTWDLRGFCFLFGAFYPLLKDAF